MPLSLTILSYHLYKFAEEIKALCGCDLLTISPKLLEELASSTEAVPVKLCEETALKSNEEKIELDEAKFRWMLNEDVMANDKLADGIRKFAADGAKLESLIKTMLTTTNGNKKA